MAEDLRPDLGHPGPLEPGAGEDRRHPAIGAAAGPVHQPQRAGELPGRGARLLRPVRMAAVVRLVHRDDVGELEDALLDALELVAGAGQGEEEEGVDHPGHGRLRLADADGLDEHDVVARVLEDEHRLGGRAGDAAEGAGGRRGADVGRGVGRQARHPGLVAEHGAARAQRGGVDREHADPVALRRSGGCRATRRTWTCRRPGRPRCRPGSWSAGVERGEQRASGGRCSSLPDSTSVIARETVARSPARMPASSASTSTGRGISARAEASRPGRGRTRR